MLEALDFEPEMIERTLERVAGLGGRVTLQGLGWEYE